MPIARSKLHYLNRKLQEISVDVCTGRILRRDDSTWGRANPDYTTLSIVERAKLIELRELIDGLVKVCQEDQGL